MFAASQLPDPSIRPESGAWDDVREGWSQVYGSFHRLGVSVESLDFQSGGALDWGRSFHPESIELCLNLAGRAEVAHGREAIALPAGSAAAYAQAARPLRARRMAGERHRFITLEFSRGFLATHLAGAEAQTMPVVRRSVFNRRAASAIAPATPLSEPQRGLAQSLAHPPVAPAALPLWYQSKVMEAVALFLIAPAPELFCARQKRVNRERIERAREILRERLVEPPSLEQLGREVGVSPFYLSRTFSQEMAMTIPQFVRRLRMERAAELLLAGGHNVTEAAFAVGYASLGHFSKSFCEIIGCCPTLYPHARHLRRP